jgi:hypothetical protein
MMRTIDAILYLAAALCFVLAAVGAKRLAPVHVWALTAGGLLAWVLVHVIAAFQHLN